MAHKDKVNDKRLPLIFLMDVSGSMEKAASNHDRLTCMNDGVAGVIKACMRKQKIREVVEVSFMLFTDEILLSSDFRNICWMDEDMMPARKDRHEFCGKITWKTVRPEAGANYNKSVMVPQFGISVDDHGTNIGYAVQQAVQKLENRVKELAKFESYSPFLILITDGHPAEPNNPRYYEDLADQKKAIEMLKRHAVTHRGENNLIFPFVIGVGGEDIDKRRLADYASVFPAGYYHIRDNAAEEDWSYLIEILAKSVRESMNINDVQHLDDVADRIGFRHDA